jgi:CheY-like chemotaxis protein
MATLFPRRKYIVWEGASRSDGTAAKKKSIESYATWALEDGGFYQEAAKIVADYIDYGNAFCTPDWLNQEHPVQGENRHQFGYVGPVARRISPLDIVFDPTAPTFTQSPKIVRSLVSIGEVKEILERMALLSHSLSIKNHVALKIEVEENMPPLECNVRRIKQILNNLITNAVKYSHAETTVFINAKYLKETNQIYLEIVDSGIGMNESEVALALAGMGRDIDKTTIERHIDSYGIGMSTVLQLVKLHNARIEIESQKGIGTKVKLFFNLLTNSKNPGHKHHSPSFLENSKKTILLVEDNPVNLKVTSTILRNAGYTTYHVENGKEALKILDEKHFDLILMDGEMPVMNGYEAAEIIRKGDIFQNFKEHAKIPIIALMSSFDEETIKMSKDSGMNDHLEKSISRSRLLDVVESYLN